jgi:predicted DNA-binding protein (MmcQ/YjbR family)
MPAAGAAKRTRSVLRDFALAYPDAHEDFPWGERVIKVRNKVFVFLGRDDGDMCLSVKLPASGVLALALPFVSPTGYGLARSGWVTARFGPREKAPVEVLRRWIDESYRAVAPRTLVAALPGRAVMAPGEPARRKVTSPKRRPGGARERRRP